MKVLVVSLLRLGDIIQQEALLAGIRQKHPGAEIHLLANKQFSSVEKILGHRVDRFHYFEREQLQQGLGEAGYNVLWSFSKLESLVKEINSLGFDFIYNFTHNKLSAYLMGAFQAANKVGLHHTGTSFGGIDNKWLRYFNERFSGNNKCLFNYVELLSKGLNIPLAPAEISTMDLKKTKLVLFQCLTSDSKKNWGLERFAALKNEIEANLVDYRVKILGAEFEREILKSQFSDEDLLICDLAEAQKHLKSARLLVTGDTSIKHLAAQSGVPMVELVLGSSDGVKTGAYTTKSLQVVTQVSCAPCVHSKPCHQKTHLCAADINVQRVFEAVWDQLSGAGKAHRVSLDQTVWRHYMDGTTPTPTLQNYSALELQKSLESTSDLMTFAQRLSQALPQPAKFMNASSLSAQDLAEVIGVAQDILRSKKDEGGYFQSLMERLLMKFTNPGQFIAALHECYEEAQQLVNIRYSLLTNKNISKEGETLYANGIGQLSGCSFEETREGVQRNPQDAEL